MSDKPCPFCGAKEIRQKTNEMTPKSWGPNGPEYEHVIRFCCKAQETNHNYQENHFLGDDKGRVPGIDEIEKW